MVIHAQYTIFRTIAYVRSESPMASIGACRGDVNLLSQKDWPSDSNMDFTDYYNQKKIKDYQPNPAYIFEG